MIIIYLNVIKLVRIIQLLNSNWIFNLHINLLILIYNLTYLNFIYKIIIEWWKSLNEWRSYMDSILISILLIFVGLIVGMIVMFIFNNIRNNKANNSAEKIILNAKEEAEKIKKDAINDAKEEANEIKNKVEEELKEKNLKLKKWKKD